MKIAIPSTGTKLDSPLNPWFGRTLNFVLYDDARGEYEVVENTEHRNSEQGAGIQAAEMLAQHGVQCLLARQCGPKAIKVLEAAGIEVHTTTALTVAAALAEFHADGVTVHPVPTD